MYDPFLNSSCDLGPVQSRVPCRGNSGQRPERTRPSPDWWRWDGRRASGDQSAVRRLRALGPQRANHYHQHVVIRAFQTGETFTVVQHHITLPPKELKPNRVCLFRQPMLSWHSESAASTASALCVRPPGLMWRRWPRPLGWTRE